MSRSLEDSTARSGREYGEPGDRGPQTVRHHEAQDDRAVYHLRERNYHLNSRQATVLKDVGSFRTVMTQSLRKHVYQGDDDRLRKDLRDLKDQGLVTIESQSKDEDRYISLARTGKNVTENHLRTSANQVIYSGI